MRLNRVLLAALLIVGAASSHALSTTAQEVIPTKKHEKTEQAYQSLYHAAKKHGVHVGRNVLANGRSKDGRHSHALVTDEARRLWWALHPEAYREYTEITKYEALYQDFRAAYFRHQTHLEKIGQCESGGRLDAVSSNGLYFGKYQFSLSTWHSVGGYGNPISSPEAVQDHFAGINYEVSNPYGQWPVCSHR